MQIKIKLWIVQFKTTLKYWRINSLKVWRILDNNTLLIWSRKAPKIKKVMSYRTAMRYLLNLAQF